MRFHSQIELISTKLHFIFMGVDSMLPLITWMNLCGVSAIRSLPSSLGRILIAFFDKQHLGEHGKGEEIPDLQRWKGRFGQSVNQGLACERRGGLGPQKGSVSQGWWIRSILKKH